jgi:NAD(P)-dependent dehydrogenase (short-subunit alcohol dehydrogenase family)
VRSSGSGLAARLTIPSARRVAPRLRLPASRQSNRNAYILPLVAIGGIAAVLIAREVIQRMRQMDLEGRVVIVTGGSRGLGFVLAREFLRHGARVAICGRDDQSLIRAEQELKELGADVLAYRCDVSDQTQVDQFIQLVARRLGPPDVLVNNAGVLEVGPLEAMDRSDFREAMDVMFWGTLNPTLAVLPYMRERHMGRIVNITSTGISVPHLLPYSSAKFAATGFSEGLRAELAGTGISVTTVSPGVVRTGWHLNANYKGHGRAEYRWLSVGSAAPLISMDAERAARQIVRAARRGEAQRILSLPANVLARLHGVAPGLTQGLTSLASRVMPSDGVGTRPTHGTEIEASLDSRLYRTVTIWGRKAADRFQRHTPPEEQAADEVPQAAEIEPRPFTEPSSPPAEARD